MRKVAFIGDSHGNYEALKAVLADAKEQHVTDYVVLGDVTNRGPQPLECVEALQNLKPIAWVIGNHEEVYYSLIKHQFKDFEINPKAVMAVITSEYDRRLLGKQKFAWLSRLPIRRGIRIENVSFSIFHATPTECRGSFSFPTNNQLNFDTLLLDSDADVAVYGHTHRFIVRMTSDGRYIFNPGSVGMPVSNRLEISGKASYGILKVANHSVLDWDQRNIPYDLEAEIKVAKERNLPYVALYESLLRTGKFTFNPEKVMKENDQYHYVERALNVATTTDW